MGVTWHCIPFEHFYCEKVLLLHPSNHKNIMWYIMTQKMSFKIGAAVFAEQNASVTSAHVGGTARFDARVTFVGGGSQQRKQKVNLLQLFKDGTQVYRCRNWSGSETSPCTSIGRFNVQMQGSEKFDFYITLNDVRVEDGGNYEARLEVIHPVTGSYLSFRKTITLNVTGKLL